MTTNKQVVKEIGSNMNGNAGRSSRHVDVGMFALLTLLVLSRLFVIGAIRSIPGMEPFYIYEGEQLFESSNRFDLFHPAGYPALLYGVNLLLHDWLLSTQAIYVVFSILLVVVCYLIAKTLFDVETARYVMLIMIFLPNLTSAVGGYSHVVVVAMFFVYLSVYVYWNLLTDGNIWRAAVFSACLFVATSLRPENVLYFVMLFVIFVGTVWYGRKGRRAGNSLMAGIVMLAIFMGGLYVEHQWILARSSSRYASVFGDGRYVYATYMSTVALRTVGEADDRVAARLSAAAFGSAKENEFSIGRAIARNPREALRTVAYNVKTLVKEAGNPLFIPVFLYPLIGVALLCVPWTDRWRQHCILGSLLLPCIVVLLLISVEMRTVTRLVPPLVMWIALGIRWLGPRVKRYMVIVLTVVMACLFTASVFHFRDTRRQYTKAGVVAPWGASGLPFPWGPYWENPDVPSGK